MKKMTFKYMSSQDEGYKIQFLQDVAKKLGVGLKNQLEIVIFLEEVGG